MGRIGEDLGKRKLTKKDRQVLGYLLENRETACFMTAAELAAILGVSPLHPWSPAAESFWPDPW